MDQYENIGAVIEVAKEAAGHLDDYLDPTKAPLAVIDGQVVNIDALVYDERRRRDDLDRPRRKEGSVVVEDAASFLTVWGKHHVGASEVWADRAESSVVAIFDAHQEADGAGDLGIAGFRKHRAVLKLTKTAQWNRWVAASGKLGRMAEVAEFIEDAMPDFVSPTGMDMLEVAQSIKGTDGTKFESSHRLNDGQSGLVYVETVEAKAGQRGQLKIPDEVRLLLQPYEGGPRYEVEARFRYRLNGAQGLLLGFVLLRADDVLRDAYEAVVAKVAEGIGEGRQVIYGRP